MSQKPCYELPVRAYAGTMEAPDPSTPPALSSPEPVPSFERGQLRMWIVAAIAVLAAILAMIGCGAKPGLTPRQKNALDAARRCAVDEHRGKGIHGSRLIFDRAEIQVSDESGDVVYIPEEEPRGRPMGLTLHIELGTSKCSQVPI